MLKTQGLLCLLIGLALRAAFAEVSAAQLDAFQSGERASLALEDPIHLSNGWSTMNLNGQHAVLHLPSSGRCRKKCIVKQDFQLNDIVTLLDNEAETVDVTEKTFTDSTETQSQTLRTELNVTSPYETSTAISFTVEADTQSPDNTTYTVVIEDPEGGLSLGTLVGIVAGILSIFGISALIIIVIIRKMGRYSHEIQTLSVTLTTEEDAIGDGEDFTHSCSMLYIFHVEKKTNAKGDFNP